MNAVAASQLLLHYGLSLRPSCVAAALCAHGAGSLLDPLGTANPDRFVPVFVPAGMFHELTPTLAHTWRHAGGIRRLGQSDHEVGGHPEILQFAAVGRMRVRLIAETRCSGGQSARAVCMGPVPLHVGEQVVCRCAWDRVGFEAGLNDRLRRDRCGSRDQDDNTQCCGKSTARFASEKQFNTPGNQFGPPSIALYINV